MLPVHSLNTMPKEVCQEIASRAPTSLSGVSKYFLNLINLLPAVNFPLTHPVYRRFLARNLFFPSAEIRSMAPQTKENRIKRAVKSARNLLPQKAKAPSASKLTVLGEITKNLLHSTFRNSQICNGPQTLLDPTTCMFEAAKGIFVEFKKQCKELGVESKSPLFIQYGEAFIEGLYSYSRSKEVNDAFPELSIHSEYLETQLSYLSSYLRFTSLQLTVEAYANQEMKNITKEGYIQMLEDLKCSCPNIKPAKLIFALESAISSKHGQDFLHALK